MDDQQLLREYVGARSEAAFAELVNRHKDWVYSICLRRIGPGPLAEDATQAVFIALARKAHSLANHRSLTGWLYQAAQFAALDARKLERRRARHEAEVAQMAAVSTSDAGMEIWSDVAGQLEPALDRLPEKYRLPILLRFYQKKTHAEVAAALHISEEAAQKRLSRALDRLRSLLGRRGVSVSASAFAGLLLAHAVHAAPPSLATPWACLSNSATLPPHLAAMTKGILHMKTLTTLKMAALVAVAILVAIPGSIFIIHASLAATAAPHGSPPAPAATAPATQPANSLKATLASGVSIEILGVGDGADAGKWWQADGSPLARVPYDPAHSIPKSMVKNLTDAAEINAGILREVALRIDRKGGAGRELPGVRCQMLGARWAAYHTDPKNAPGLGQVLGVLMGQPDDLTIRCDVAGGEWVVALAGPADQGATRNENGISATIGAGEEVKGVTQFSYEYTAPSSGPPAELHRLVAVDTEGKVHPTQIRSSRSTAFGKEMVQTSVYQVNLPLNKIKELQFQIRPLDEWVEFRHVSVHPGDDTEPEVLTSDKAKDEAR